jgi:hypothetical protein
MLRSHCDRNDARGGLMSDSYMSDSYKRACLETCFNNPPENNFSRERITKLTEEICDDFINSKVDG